MGERMQSNMPLPPPIFSASYAYQATVIGPGKIFTQQSLGKGNSKTQQKMFCGVVRLKTKKNPLADLFPF
jgi:hypothetical protein